MFSCPLGRRSVSLTDQSPSQSHCAQEAKTGLHRPGSTLLARRMASGQRLPLLSKAADLLPLPGETRSSRWSSCPRLLQAVASFRHSALSCCIWPCSLLASLPSPLLLPRGQPVFCPGLTLCTPWLQVWVLTGLPSVTLRGAGHQVSMPALDWMQFTSKSPEELFDIDECQCELKPRYRCACTEPHVGHCRAHVC